MVPIYEYQTTRRHILGYGREDSKRRKFKEQRGKLVTPRSQTTLSMTVAIMFRLSREESLTSQLHYRVYECITLPCCTFKECGVGFKTMKYIAIKKF